MRLGNGLGAGQIENWGGEECEGLDQAAGSYVSHGESIRAFLFRSSSGRCLSSGMNGEDIYVDLN